MVGLFFQQQHFTSKEGNKLYTSLFNSRGVHKPWTFNKISPSYQLDFVQDVHVERATHLCQSVHGPFVLISVDEIDQTEHQSDEL